MPAERRPTGPALAVVFAVLLAALPGCFPYVLPPGQLEVGLARDGSYRRIMIVVENSALEMHDVTVHFADGTSFSPPTRHVFAANTRSHVIDLPGTRRSIQSIEFRYGNLPGGGRAQAELWAQ